MKKFTHIAVSGAILAIFSAMLISATSPSYERVCDEWAPGRDGSESCVQWNGYRVRFGGGPDFRRQFMFEWGRK